MSKKTMEDAIRQYVNILEHGGKDDLAWLIEELVDNPNLLEQDDPAVLGEFQIGGRRVTEKFVTALILGILQTQERNIELNPAYQPNITAPLGYYSVEKLYNSVDDPLTNALRDLEKYGDSGEGFGSTDSDEALINNIKGKGYSDKTARLMCLAYSVGGITEKLPSTESH